MPQASKTFRIFVSSTFSDLKEERNALQKYVFPLLRELCRQHGCRFQPIDLRWGVSEEAGLDQQTMKICLEEIKRCRPDDSWDGSRYTSITSQLTRQEGSGLAQVVTICPSFRLKACRIKVRAVE
jgi:hypothetical protein